MLETQLRSESTRPARGSKVRYAPRESGDDIPGRSPMSTSTMRPPRAMAISSPSATRDCSATTTGATDQPGRRGSSASTTATAWSCTARAESPSAITTTRSWSPDSSLWSWARRRPRSGRWRYSARSAACECTTGPARSPSAATISPASSGVCTASRAWAWAAASRRFSAVDRPSPARPRPTRARVAARSVSQGSVLVTGSLMPSEPGSARAPAAAPGRRRRADPPTRARPRTRARAADRASAGPAARPGRTATGS